MGDGQSLAMIVLDGKLTFTEMRLTRTPVSTYNSIISIRLTALNEAPVIRAGFQPLLYVRQFLTSTLRNIRTVHAEPTQGVQSTI